MGNTIGVADAANFPNNLFSASSATLAASGARLQGASAWQAATLNDNQWLGVDLKKIYEVTGISTQGGGAAVAGWVTSYRVSYAEDISNAKMVPGVYGGNTDATGVIYNKFPESFKARYIKIHPVAWNAQIALRVEFTFNEFPERPWYHLDFSESACHAKRHHYANFAPTYDRFEVVYNIAFIGAMGAGKSTTFNEIQSVQHGGRTSYSRAGLQKNTGSMTTAITVIGFGPLRGVGSRLKFWDLPGFDPTKDLATNYPHLNSIIAGHWKKGTVVEAQMDPDSSRHREYYIPLPKLADRIHCMVLVIDAVLFADTPAHKQMYRKMYEHTVAMGIGSFVLVTKLDLIHGEALSSQIQADPTLILRSAKVRELIALIHSELGIEEKFIKPISNHTVAENANHVARDCLYYDAIDGLMEVCGSYYWNNEEKLFAEAAQNANQHP